MSEKTVTAKSTRKMGSRIGVSILLALMLFGLVSLGWARTFTMRASPVAPGATGTIDVNAEKERGNTSLTIKVEHLGRPTLLSPPANQYVVWIKPSGGGAAQQAGVLTVGEDHKGELKTTTTESKFAVVVTAETDGNPKSPSNRAVLQAEVQE